MITSIPYRANTVGRDTAAIVADALLASVFGAAPVDTGDTAAEAVVA
jgi:hypothetical protein